MRFGDLYIWFGSWKGKSEVRGGGSMSLMPSSSCLTTTVGEDRDGCNCRWLDGVMHIS